VGNVGRNRCPAKKLGGQVYHCLSRCFLREATPASSSTTNIRKKHPEGNEFFGVLVLTIIPNDSTIMRKYLRVIDTHHPLEICMKTAIPSKNEPKHDKKLLKRLALSDKRFRLTGKNNQRLKIVKSVTAGHVRGGHSFH